MFADSNFLSHFFGAKMVFHDTYFIVIDDAQCFESKRSEPGRLERNFSNE
jgi:hypothetical protein